MLRFASLSSEEREYQIVLTREMNKLLQEGADLSEVDYANLQDQARNIAQRSAALKTAQADAAIISGLVDNSQANIEASVQRNIQLAKDLLEARKITEGDYARFVEDQVKRVTSLNKEAADDSKKYWEEAAKGIQGALQTFFFDAMQGNMTDLVGSFKKMIDQMVAQALAAKLMQTLFGNNLAGGQVGGFAGTAASFLGGLFGGARAGGGDVQAGKSYLVGEKGPEVATFGRNGTITPNSELSNLGGSTQVSVTIQATDAKSFLQQADAVKREMASMFNDTNRRYNLRAA
jgi:hypothetical protein